MSLFITFEGIDGCGKTTQAERVAEWLKETGYDVLLRREPGGTEIGEEVRSLLLNPRWKKMTGSAEFLLYSASRAQLVQEVIRPHLARPNSVMLLDRFGDSSTAYQGCGRELGMDVVETINRFATGGMEPNLTIVLDVDWYTAQERLDGGDVADRLEANPREFFERVREAYRELTRRHPSRMVSLDGMRSENAVFKNVQEVIRPVLPKLISED